MATGEPANTFTKRRHSEEEKGGRERLSEAYSVLVLKENNWLQSRVTIHGNKQRDSTVYTCGRDKLEQVGKSDLSLQSQAEKEDTG